MFSTPPPERPPKLNVTYSYDNKQKHDTEGEIYLRDLSSGYYDNFLDNLSSEQFDAINVYQNVNQCDIMHKALDIGQLVLYNKVSHDLNELPYNGTPQENEARDFIRSKTIVPDYVETIRELDNLFDIVPPTPVSLTTYRCYANYINLERLKELFNDIPNPELGINSNKRYVSTSLSRKLVEKWCEKGDSKLKICILIPQGSKGVIPLLLFKKENFRQNEITLPRNCALKFSGFNHIKHKYPIFVYVKNKSESIDEYIPMIESGNYNLIRTPIKPSKTVIIRKRVPEPNRPIITSNRIESSYDKLGGKRKTRKFRKMK